MLRRNTPLAIVVGTLLVIASTACGGDDDAVSGDDTSPGTEESVGSTSTSGEEPPVSTEPTEQPQQTDGADDAATSDPETAPDPTDGETTTDDDPFAAFLGDLAQPCTVISADEMSALLGGTVETDDTYATDCFYNPIETPSETFDVHTSTLALPDEACLELLQTEPILPGETVVPAPDYGDHASLITTESAAEIQACQGGIAFDVSVLGDGLQPPEDMEAVARSVLDLLIERT